MNKWTINKIKLGFEKFLEENGRLPTAPEIDRAEYLPSARTLQRSFGGVEGVRRLLGYEQVHFGKGDFRREIALQAYKVGLQAEHDLEARLIKKFGEPFVHIEKRVGMKKNRLDFFIYSPSGNLGIDIFYPSSFRDLQKNVNIKITKFVDVGCEVIFVVATSDYKQTLIDNWILNKRKFMPDNTKVMNLENFIRYIEPFKSYPDPTN